MGVPIRPDVATFKDDRLQEREEFERKIIGQVFDSPPDFRSIAKGVAQSVGAPPSSLMATAVEMVVRMYLTLTAKTAGLSTGPVVRPFITMTSVHRPCGFIVEVTQ